MSVVREANIGIQSSQKEALATKLQAVYSEREALTNQIRAAQWNTQGPRASELLQVLSASSPDNQSQQKPYRSRLMQTVQPFAPSNEIAERISMMGGRVPSSYQEMDEYSRIEPQKQGADVQRTADSLANACEHFSQTTRKAIQFAKQADDEVSVQALTDQLHPAEQLAMQLRRF
ncbi:hypothetical protein N9V90_01810 [Endozoicomonas sp.]|nr:hypothetical protein [Endozoicomonas sp.]